MELPKNIRTMDIMDWFPIFAREILHIEQNFGKWGAEATGKSVEAGLPTARIGAMIDAYEISTFPFSHTFPPDHRHANTSPS